jgi:Na+-translocating ferredoxin:NAD+ oxidoreductase subunit B
MEKQEKKIGRREFIGSAMRVSVGLAIGSMGGVLLSKAMGEHMVWQLDPALCVQCGRCATECVLTPSAVKCTHVYSMCGYCDLCGGYFKPDTKNLTTAAENQLCPTAAIERKFIEEPFFEYHINEDLCIGCGKCVAGCGSFGNGSMQLQVRHNLCVNCNQCSIATHCPANAFKRVPASSPYIFKGFKEDKKA